MRVFLHEIRTVLQIVIPVPNINDTAPQGLATFFGFQRTKIKISTMKIVKPEVCSDINLLATDFF